MSSSGRWGRRGFLKGVGAAAALSPLARYAPAEAQVATSKLLVFATGNSWLVGWDGNERVSGWGLPGVSELGPTLQDVALPDRLPDIFSPLEPFADDLLIVDNLRGFHLLPEDFPHATVRPHQQAASLLTGTGVYDDEAPRSDGGDGEWYSKGPSIDQLFAEQTGTEVLGFAFRPDGYQIGEGRISHFGPNRAYVPIQNPQDGFEAVYGVDTSDPAAERALARRRAIVGLHGADTEAMLSRLPERDRAILAEHAASVSTIRGRLDGAGVSCSAAMPDYDYNPTRSENAARLMEDYADLMTGALACGRTRAGYMQLGTMGGGNVRPQWPELGIDEYPTDHSINHSFEGDFQRSDLEGYGQEQIWDIGVRLQQAYNTMFAGILRRLRDTPDVDGRPMLDNTVVVHIKQMRTNHLSNRHLVLVAGGRALGVRGGRFLRVEGETDRRPPRSRDQRWLNDMWTGIAGHLGMDLDTLGYPEANTEPLNLG